jgi:MFS family permease
MDDSSREDQGTDRPKVNHEGLDCRPTTAAIARALIVGILLALAGAWVATTVADRHRGIENVEHGTKYRGTHLSIETAARNAALAYGLLGGILALIMGVIAGSLLGRFSIARASIGSLAGIVLGASLGAESAYVLTPVYLNRLGTADITLTMLIHLGIWTSVGAASGIAFGIGSGTRTRLLMALAGGMAGGALAAVLFDVCGALFPLAHTERPLAEEAPTRLAAALLLSFLIVVGVVVMAAQEPRKVVPRSDL